MAPAELLVNPSASPPPSPPVASIQHPPAQLDPQWTPPFVDLPSSPPTGRNPQLSRPSHYLQERCALCFGGSKPRLAHSPSHAIVCLDACFSQKRRHTEREPPFFHPNSYFISEQDCHEMERHVNTLRERASGHNQKPTRVAEEVLEDCQRNFIAAQELVAKASKAFFADTGLMALLCRHDNVLWLVNLTTPGERQFYALILLKRLFQHLPLDWHVGVLYDIGCQLDHSLAKFNYLGDDIRERIHAAISVFHAYGHQWQCQLEFHPRKCCGFGLTDGEGCERCWSRLKRLIPSLRVSGYHRRLFVIDTHVTYINDHSAEELSEWMRRKWINLKKREAEAAQELTRCGFTTDELRNQWASQKAKQLQPLARQSKNAGEKQIRDILFKRRQVASLEKQISTLQTCLNDPSLDSDAALGLETDLAELQDTCSIIVEVLHQQEGLLGVTARQNLQGLLKSKFIAIRANAKLLKHCIREKLVSRKFEMSKLERSYRASIMDQKSSLLTQTSIRRRQRGISELVKQYNKLCDQLQQLIDARKAPHGAVAPPPIDSTRLFRLDVDDSIWFDTDLEDDDGPPPPWLADPNVRSGIVAMHDADRCREEKERLRAELVAFGEWLEEEWLTLHQCLILPSLPPTIRYQILTRIGSLRRLSLVWQEHSQRCPTLPRLHQRPTPNRARINPPLHATPPLLQHDTFSDSSSDSTSSDLPDEEDLDGEVAEEFLSRDRSHSDGAGSSDGTASEDDIDCVSDDPIAVDSVPSSQHTAATRHLPAPIGSPLSYGSTFVPPLTGTPLQTSARLTSEQPNTPAKSRPEPGRIAGHYFCDGHDITRFINNPQCWINGRIISLAAKASRLRLIHVHSVLMHYNVPFATLIPPAPRDHLAAEVLLDMKALTASRAQSDPAKTEALRQTILRHIRKVRHPRDCLSWLIPVCEDFHWSLVEVSWRDCQCRLFDSLNDSNGRWEAVFTLVGQFLEFACHALDISLNGRQWTRVDELRPARQTNQYDCGMFVISDLWNIMDLGQPAGLVQDDVAGFRRMVGDGLRGLPARTVVPVPPPALATIHLVDDH